MSLHENDVWMENCKENFDEALVENNFEMAEACVQDARSAGFTSEATVMEEELKNTKKTLQADMDSI